MTCLGHFVTLTWGQILRLYFRGYVICVSIVICVSYVIIFYGLVSKKRYLFILCVEKHARLVTSAALLFPGTQSDGCGCPNGFSRCAGRCLRLMRERSTYYEANSGCVARLAILATPRTREESDCAAAIAAGKVAWMGYDGSQTSQTFYGVDGCGKTDYDNWADGQPIFATQGISCVTMDSDTGTWVAEACTEKYEFLCQTKKCHRPECPDE